MFQSTPPAWGATADGQEPGHYESVSIHAPRVGGDMYAQTHPDGFKTFQSTPPAWGATLVAR